MQYTLHCFSSVSITWQVQTTVSYISQLLILCLISLLFGKFKTALINNCDLSKIVLTERRQRLYLCWFMMLLLPPSETSSTIDICRWWRGNPHVWAELTGWDVCHEGASFCSHHASYKLILRGILSFLLSSSAALFWRLLSAYFSSPPTFSLLIFSSIAIFSLLCSCDAFVHISNLWVFIQVHLCRTVAEISRSHFVRPMLLFSRFSVQCPPKTGCCF